MQSDSLYNLLIDSFSTFSGKYIKHLEDNIVYVSEPNIIFALTSKCIMLGEKAANINFDALNLTKQGPTHDFPCQKAIMLS